MTKSFLYNSWTNVSNIIINQTSVTQVLFAGKVGPEQQCYGSDFVDKFGKYTNSIVQGFIKVTISDSYAKVDLESNIIHLNSGTVCHYNNFEYLDSNMGYTSWNVKQLEKSLSLIYLGNAIKTIHNKTDEIDILYTVDNNEFAFTFKRKQKVILYGKECFQTDQPELFIKEIDYKVEKNIEAIKSIQSGGNLVKYMNAKFVYVERHISTQIEHLYANIIHQCVN